MLKRVYQIAATYQFGVCTTTKHNSIFSQAATISPNFVHTLSKAPTVQIFALPVPTHYSTVAPCDCPI